MIRYSVFALLLLTSSIFLNAQSACEINDVHTNPDPAFVRPALGSSQPAYHTNHFDWTAPFWPIRWPGVLTGFVPPGNPTNPDYVYIVSPFFDPTQRLNYISKDLESDFHPRDGWELLAMDFGMENADGSLIREGPFKEGYLFLYNKHTSTIRALMTPWDDDNVTSLDMQFKLEPKTGDDASGLFAGAGDILNPLDHESPTRTVSARIAPAPGARGSWAHADIPVFYDPCSCTRDQRLRTKYKTNTSGEISLYGLYAGTISTLQVGSAGYALPFPQDPEKYLATLNTRYPEDIRPGSVVAKDKQALTDQYQNWVTSLENRNSGSLLSGVYDVVSLLGDAAGLFGVKAILGVTVASAVKGLGIASKTYSKLAKPTGNEVSPEAYLPSYTQGEIMLRGSFTSLGEWDAIGQDIALPGTQWTLDPDEVSPFVNNTKPQYPLYNETLGLFAILHAPKVKVRANGNSGVIFDGGDGWNYVEGWRHEWRQYQFDGELDYVWNPASHVDVENTRIHAALIVEQIKANGATSGLCSGVSDNDVGNGQRLYDADVVSGVAQSSVYATEFVGLECLSELPLLLHRTRHCPYSQEPPPAGFFRETDSVVIRLVMDVRFKPNEYGVRNRSTIIYTLPVELVEEEDTLVGDDMPTYNENLTVGSITHTIPYDVFVHSTITINGEVKTNPTTNLASYVAGEEIVVQSGATIGMNTRLAIDYGTPCGKPRIAPYAGDLNAFCTSNQYKAKELSNEARAGDDSQSGGANTQYVDRLYARLEIGSAAFEVVSERTNDPIVAINIYDVVGSLVSTAFGANGDKSTTRTLIDTSCIASGAYIIVVASGGRQTSLKVLYTP